ncbi:DUF6241 domain-containing protein [Bacillus sp. FJAT-27231]|uniref:DUF6241 domain-containing protein n=1 Tax=Bacillus sp. FJAT-27231 TaxID=1679168 RepID=UPI000A70CAC5|nr:DUF6241 domain-containing protein [Bacillus sp. FJAT-27231]
MDIKKIASILLSIVTIFAVFGGIALTIMSADGPAEKEAQNKPIQTKEEAKVNDEFLQRQIKVNGESNTELPALIVGNEPQVTEMMHQMTHQKVVADEKWGAIEMTPDNIAALKKHVMENDFKSEAFFLEILDRWESGNFDKVDKDHNALWRAQEGTIGIAYDLMTE